MHWCSQETEMLMSLIFAVSFYFRVGRYWLATKFGWRLAKPKLHEHEHECCDHGSGPIDDLADAIREDGHDRARSYKF